MILAAGTAETAAPLLELGLVLVIVATLARLAARVGLSPIPLYLLAGLFLGSGSPVGLDASDDFIEVAATLGVVLLLFFLGLEYTSEELTTNLRLSAKAGLFDLVNAIPGVLFGLALGWSLLASVVLGGITYISSSGVIAKTLTDLGRLGNRETPTILSILVIEDLAMAVYLPIITGLMAGGAALAVGANVAIGIVLVVLVLVIAARFGEHISRVVFSRFDEVVLFSILAIVFLVAGAAESIGVSAGVGAFLVGIALSGRAQQRAETLIAPLRDLFAAAFFIFFTFQIDASTLPSAIVPALLLAVVTAVLKVVTGWWAARRAGIGRAGRLRAGLTLIARGEFSIVIAGIAVVNGVEPDLGPLAATYVLVLAIVGPILTRGDEWLGRLWPPRPKPVAPTAVPPG